MKIGSLFSGGGLGDFGFLAAGFKIAWQCEIDDYCQKVLALRYPESVKYRDIKTLKGNEIEKVDIITGGFPCQDISQANTMAKGLDGERSGLWREMWRVLGELRPKYIVVENTAALTFRGLGRILADLATLGYSAQWFVFPASLVGAPHRRERVWILAHTNGDRLLYSLPHRCFEEKQGIKKRFWGQYWDEIGSGLTGNEPISSMEEAKREAMVRPWVCRVSDGSTNTLERLKMLGNGQVPACTYVIGKMIMEIENESNT